MQTYTHMAAGMVVGEILFPDNHVAQGLCVLGSFIPDIVAGITLHIDKFKKRPPSFNNWPKCRIGYAVLHSTPIWCVVFVASLLAVSNYGVALSIGALSHVLVDPFTHGGRASDNRMYNLHSNDDLFLFPWKFKLGKVIGFWEYRPDTLVLTPKPWEAIVFGTLVLVGVWLYL